MHLTDTAMDKYCSSSVTGLTGSPMIFGAGAPALAVVTGTNTVHAYALKATGGGCTEDIPFSVFGTTPNHPTLGPPSAKGSGIYFGYDNTANVTSDLGIKSIQFSGTAFSSQSTRNVGRQPTTNTAPAPIAPASDLFFGSNGDHTFFRHSQDLSPLSWAPSALASSQNVFSPPTVSGNLMFAMSNTLTAFKLSDAGTAWVYSTGLTQVSPPAIATSTYFVSNQQNREMVAFNASDQAQRWLFQGSATTPSTRMNSLGTEAVLGADGVLYFADNQGRVYALYADDTPATAAAGDWPRTGYDNCNSNHSNNTGFTCQ
jgi:outer membrane protein assembly factor BamB